MLTAKTNEKNRFKNPSLSKRVLLPSIEKKKTISISFYIFEWWWMNPNWWPASHTEPMGHRSQRQVALLSFPPHRSLPSHFFSAQCSANKQLSHTRISAAVNPNNRSSPVIGLSNLFLLSDFFRFIPGLLISLSLSVRDPHAPKEERGG